MAPDIPRRAPRSLPLGIPPRGWLLSGWSLLVLRAFLAFTFLYAGLQKLANPAFLDYNSSSGIRSQMIGAIHTSPIHLVLGHLLRFSTPIGISIALGELAVGLGIALGLWTRLAAIGGMVLSLSLFLAVSFNASPWYTGADIVYLFAFTPFVIAGAGGVLSLDAIIARRSAREARLDDPLMVVLPFAEVQRVCGSFDRGRCTAIVNRLCESTGCPYLEGVRLSLPTGRTPDHVDRRAVVLGGVAAATVAGIGIVTAGAAAGIGRAAGRVKLEPSTTDTFPPTTATTGSTPPGATLLGPSSIVGVNQSAPFTVPSNGDPGLLIQPSAGQYVAYDAVCPHAGCTVQYSAANNVLACPCHGSEFSVDTGAVIVGPAEIGLTPLTVTDSGGDLYVT